MKKICVDKNLTIVIKSIFFTIIGMILFSFIWSMLNTAGVHISYSTVLQNIFLDITILIVQYLLLRKYYRGKTINEIGLNYERGSLLYITKGIMLGILIVILPYLTVFIMGIVSCEGIGFNYYNVRTIAIFLIGLFVRMAFVGIAEEVFF